MVAHLLQGAIDVLAHFKFSQDPRFAVVIQDKKKGIPKKRTFERQYMFSFGAARVKEGLVSVLFLCFELSCKRYGEARNA